MTDPAIDPALAECLDCRWHVIAPARPGEEWHACTRPRSVELQSVVTGAIERRELAARGCEMERRTDSEGACGPTAKHFETFAGTGA